MCIYKVISKGKCKQFNDTKNSSYLTSRGQRVVVNGAISREVHAISGVPQGSVLGPLLFLIYINSASGLLFSPRTYITLYADDILMYKEIRKADDFSQLQSDL